MSIGTKAASMSIRYSSARSAAGTMRAGSCSRGASDAVVSAAADNVSGAVVAVSGTTWKGEGTIFRVGPIRTCR